MRCFEILGIEVTASPEEVKTAYRRLAVGCHPDHGGDTAEFHRLHLAYLAALAVAERPVLCSECRGLGSKTIVVGWSSQTTDCPVCGGVGTVPRP